MHIQLWKFKLNFSRGIQVPGNFLSLMYESLMRWSSMLSLDLYPLSGVLQIHIATFTEFSVCTRTFSITYVSLSPVPPHPHQHTHTWCMGALTYFFRCWNWDARVKYFSKISKFTRAGHLEPPLSDFKIRVLKHDIQLMGTEQVTN